MVGNSAVQAISLLLQKGVQEGNIIFLNLISVSFEYQHETFPRVFFFCFLFLFFAPFYSFTDVLLTNLVYDMNDVISFVSSGSSRGACSL